MSKIDDELAAILAAHQELQTNTRRAEWSLRRTAPIAIKRTAEARVARMKETSEPFRRMPRTEHARVATEIEREETGARTLAAGVARWRIEPTTEALSARLRAFVAAAKRDTSRSFPDAGMGVTPDGMIMLRLLTETMRPAIEQASVSELLQRYQRAFDTGREATSRMEAELIEQRVERGGLASSESDLTVAKQLREVIESTQHLRVPPDVQGITETITHALRLIDHADAAGVRPINAEQPANVAAKQAFEAEDVEFEDAEAATTAAAVRE